MVQVTRLAHVGLQAKSLSTQAEFYNDRWGLERVDEFGREVFFRADGPDHHVLTLTEGDQAGVHHVALQVPMLDDIDRAYEDLLARGVHRSLLELQRRCHGVGEWMEAEFFAHRPLTGR